MTGYDESDKLKKTIYLTLSKTKNKISTQPSNKTNLRHQVGLDWVGFDELMGLMNTPNQTLLLKIPNIKIVML